MAGAESTPGALPHAGTCSQYSGGFAGLHVALSPLKAHTSCLCMGESWQTCCPYQQSGRFKNLGLGTCWLPWSEWISIPLTVHDFQDIWKYFKGFQRTGCVWLRGRPKGYEYWAILGARGSKNPSSLVNNLLRGAMEKKQIHDHRTR